MPTIVPIEAVPDELHEQLLDAVFGPDRTTRTAYRIREGLDRLDGLSFAALDDEDYLAGTIELWPVSLTDEDGRQYPLLMVGPVAVAPSRQNEGYGRALMAAALGAIEGPATVEKPALPQVLIGDPEYYDKWDFTAAPTGGWDTPGPVERHRLLVRCTNPAVLPARGMLGPWRNENGRDGV
ncbi:GNAT family N-acetyltransferase [Alteriqipengyuania sp. 357]